jgi:hypothetical protein
VSRITCARSAGVHQLDAVLDEQIAACGTEDADVQ